MPGRSVAALAVLCFAASGCDEDCCTQVDSFPIPLVRAPLGGPTGGEGALIADAERRDAPGQRIQMVVATGSPLTLLAGDSHLATQKSGFDLLDPDMTRPDNPVVLRARFRNLDMLHLPVGLVGGGTGSIAPGGVVGGDLLRGYSVEFRFSPPSMTFWGQPGRRHRLPAGRRLRGHQVHTLRRRRDQRARRRGLPGRTRAAGVASDPRRPARLRGAGRLHARHAARNVLHRPRRRATGDRR